MTVIQPNSIAGINSITAQGDTLTLYKSNGTTIGQLNVNINASSGVSTVNNLIANGNVGIGTTTPSAKLDVLGAITASSTINAGATIQALQVFQSSSGQDIILNANGANRDAIFQVNGSELMRLQGSTSRLGIGTTNPTQPLSVIGNAYVSGNIAVGTTSGTGTNSNVAPVIAGNHVSFTGSVSATHNTATTLFSLNNLNSSYIVSAFVTGTSDAANYVAMYMVGSVTANSHVISAIKSGGLLTLSLSGANVQATQSSGITQTITWSVTRMANV
jgi:hypothetical protein